MSVLGVNIVLGPLVAQVAGHLGICEALHNRYRYGSNKAHQARQVCSPLGANVVPLVLLAVGVGVLVLHRHPLSLGQQRSTQLLPRVGAKVLQPRTGVPGLVTLITLRMSHMG